jgi:hypothetical protein
MPTWQRQEHHVDKLASARTCFERMCRVMLASGLNWRTLQKKWPGIKHTFGNFDTRVLARVSGTRHCANEPIDHGGARPVQRERLCGHERGCRDDYRGDEQHRDAATTSHTDVHTIGSMASVTTTARSAWPAVVTLATFSGLW